MRVHLGVDLQKYPSSISVIIVASGTLASDILTCDTCLVKMKDGLCAVSRRPVSISVSWTLLRNTSKRIAVIPENKSSSSLLCETFGNQTEGVSQSCGEVRTIRGKSSSCFCVGDKFSAQTIVSNI